MGFYEQDKTQKQLHLGLKLDQLLNGGLVIFTLLVEDGVYFPHVGQHQRDQKETILPRQQLHPCEICKLVQQLTILKSEQQSRLACCCQLDVINQSEQQRCHSGPEPLVVAYHPEAPSCESQRVHEHHPPADTKAKNIEDQYKSSIGIHHPYHPYTNIQPSHDRTHHFGGNYQPSQRDQAGNGDSIEMHTQMPHFPIKPAHMQCLQSHPTTKHQGIQKKEGQYGAYKRLLDWYYFSQFTLFKFSNYAQDYKAQGIQLRQEGLRVGREWGGGCEEGRSAQVCVLLLAPYNNCSKIAMQHRKISEQEANRLFETTFLLISQQNMAAKQRRRSGIPSPPPSSPEQSPKSPPKEAVPVSCSTGQQVGSGGAVTQGQNCAQWAFLQTDTIWPFQKSFSSSEESPRRTAGKRRRRVTEQGSDGFQWQSRPPRKLPELLVSPKLPIKQQAQGDPEEPFEDLYIESMMKDLKRDLEIKYRGKLCKSQEVNHRTGQVLGYNFLCKTNNHCPFRCFLQFAGKRNVDNEKLYKLNVICGEHQKECIQGDQEVAFMRLTKIIDGMERPIITLLTDNPDLKPKEILITMAKHIGEEPKFIYSGLSSKDYLKAAKKYFDNLIAKLKNQLAPPPPPVPPQPQTDPTEPMPPS